MLKRRVFADGVLGGSIARAESAPRAEGGPTEGAPRAEGGPTEDAPRAEDVATEGIPTAGASTEGG